ncbi:MAG: WH2 domain-containing protein [Candidatus Nucleicultricaceae bacterium]
MKKFFLSVSAVVIGASTLNAEALYLDTPTIFDNVVKSSVVSLNPIQEVNEFEVFEKLKTKAIEQILKEMYAFLNKKNVKDVHHKVFSRGESTGLSLSSQNQQRVSDFTGMGRRLAGDVSDDVRSSGFGGASGYRDDLRPSHAREIVVGQHDAQRVQNPMRSLERSVSSAPTGAIHSSKDNGATGVHGSTHAFSYPRAEAIDSLIRFAVSRDKQHFMVDGQTYITEEGKKEALAKIAEKLKSLKNLKEDAQEAYLNAMYADQDSEEYAVLKKAHNRLEDKIEALEIEIKEDVDRLDAEVKRADLARQQLEEDLGEDFNDLRRRAEAAENGEIEINLHADLGHVKPKANVRNEQRSEADIIIGRLKKTFDDAEDIYDVDFDALMAELALDDTTERQQRIDPSSPKSMVRGIHDWLTEETAADSPEALEMVRDLPKDERDAILLELSKIKGAIKLEEKFLEETQGLKEVNQKTKAAGVLRDNTRRYIDQRAEDWEKVKGFQNARDLDVFIADESERYDIVQRAYTDKFAEMRYGWLHKELENHKSIKEKEKNTFTQLKAFAEEALDVVCERYYELNAEDRGILRKNVAHRLIAFDLGGTKPAENPEVDLATNPEYVAKLPVSDVDFSDTILDTLTPEESLALWARMNKEGLDRENKGFPKRTIFYKNLTNKVQQFFADEKDRFDVEVSLKPSEKFASTHAPLKALKLHKLMLLKNDLMRDALKQKAAQGLRDVRHHYTQLEQAEKALLRSPSGTLYNTAHLILVGEYDAGSEDFDDMFASDRVKLRELTSDELIAFRFYIEENFLHKEGLARAKLKQCYQEVKKLVDAMFVDGAGKEEEAIILKPKTYKEEEPLRRARERRASLAKKESFIHGVLRKADEIEHEIHDVLSTAPEAWRLQLLQIKAYGFMFDGQEVKDKELQGLMKTLSNKEKIVFFAHALRHFGLAVVEKERLKAEMEKLFKDGADKLDHNYQLTLKNGGSLDEALFKALPLPKKEEVNEGGPNIPPPPPFGKAPPPPPPGKMPAVGGSKGGAPSGDASALFAQIRGNKKGNLRRGGLEKLLAQEGKQQVIIEEKAPEDLSLKTVLEKIKDRVLAGLQLKKVQEEAQDLKEQWGDTYGENRTGMTSSKSEVLEARLRRFHIFQRFQMEGDDFADSKAGGLLNDELVKLDGIIDAGGKSQAATQEKAYADAMRPLRLQVAEKLKAFGEDAIIQNAPKAGAAMVRDLAYLKFLKLKPQEVKGRGFDLVDMTIPKNPLAASALANMLQGVFFDKESVRSKVDSIVHIAKQNEMEYMTQMNELYRMNLTKTLLAFDKLFANKTSSPIANQKIALLRSAKAILETRRSDQITDEMLQEVDVVNMPYFVISALYGHVTAPGTHVDESSEARINFMDKLTTVYYQVALPEVAKDIELEMLKSGEFEQLEKSLERQKQNCARAIKRMEDAEEREKAKSTVKGKQVEEKKKPRVNPVANLLKKPMMPSDLMDDLNFMTQGLEGLRKKKAASSSTGQGGSKVPPPPGRMSPPPPPPPGPMPMPSNVGGSSGGNNSSDKSALLAQIQGGFKLRKTQPNAHKKRNDDDTREGL